MKIRIEVNELSLNVVNELSLNVVNELSWNVVNECSFSRERNECLAMNTVNDEDNND